MKKEVLEAGLGNVQVEDGSTGGSGGGDDVRDERAAVVGIDVELTVTRLADFGHSLQPSHGVGEACRPGADLQAHEVAAGNGLLQLLRRSDSDDLAVIDDGHALAEAVGLLHVVRGQEDGLAARVVPSGSSR